MVYINKDHYHDQGYTNPGCQVAQATKFFFAVAPIVCGSSMWIPLLVPRILSLLVYFRKICATLLMVDDNYRGGGDDGNVNP